MSALFPHRVLAAKSKGFVFVVIPEDDESEILVENAATAEKILNEKFEAESDTGMTPKDAKNGEEVDMVYADAITLLEKYDFPLVDCLIISSVIVVGDLVVVTASIGDIEDEDDEDEEELSDDDFE